MSAPWPEDVLWAAIHAAAGAAHDDLSVCEALHAPAVLAHLAAVRAEGREAGLREAAAVCAEEAATLRAEDATNKEELGSDYDPHSYGAGFDQGGGVTAAGIANTILALINKELTP